MRTRLSIVLPTSIGVLSALLTAWDIYNWHVIVSMGMAWDTGAPIWPYQTSDVLLRFINLPAFLVAMPLANLFKLLAPTYHLFVFPAGIVWWWFVGTRFDRRAINRRHQRRWTTFVGQTLCSGLLLSVAIAELVNLFHWWTRYGGWQGNLNTAVGMLRFLTIPIWFLTAAGVAAIAAKTTLIGRSS
ncbi:MAG TPA: hypothetical protein VGI45_23085 [Terracidiphilus sp.]|jgi:hypothetical protein